MGFSTVKINKYDVKKYYKVSLVVSASFVDYFNRLPGFECVADVDISDNRKIFFNFNNGAFVEIEY